MNTLAYNSKTKKQISVGEVCANQEGILCIDSKCRLTVFARRGKTNEWHFAHHQTDIPCSGKGNGGESRAHYDAKHLIAKNIQSIAFAKQRCYCCAEKRYHIGTIDSRPKVEGSISDSSYIADVLLSNKEGVHTHAVEVFNTHKVTDEKLAFCKKNNIVVIEISVDAIAEAMKNPLGTLGIKYCVSDPAHMQDIVCDKCTAAGLEENPNWRNNKAMVLQRGFKRARIQLENRLTGPKKQRLGKCVGKCKKCGDWMFSDNTPSPQYVVASDYTKKEWYALLADTPKKYRVPYLDGGTTICGHCSIQCPACDGYIPLETLARVGACLECSELDFALLPPYRAGGYTQELLDAWEATKHQ
jgi:hypothetical protein